MMVMCDRCGKHPALVHITQITGNEKVQLHLCQSCALEVGKMSAKSFMDSRAQAGRTCPNCRTTWSSFVKTGLLGCPECYNAFAEELEGVLRRMHGTAQHVQAPKEAKAAQMQSDEPEEIAQLKAQLQSAVEAEEYEEAARLRDMIRDLKAEV